MAGFASASGSVLGGMGRTAIDLNEKLALRLVSGMVAGGTEFTYDLVSYIISKLMANF